MSIFLEIEENVAGQIFADEHRVLQILANLLSNAVKFSRPRGTVKLSCRTAGPSLIFKVSDDGIGIEEHHLSKVFDKFWQADSSTTRRFGGLGIGLAIAKELAEAHGGALTVESAGKDQGASFILSLPVSGGTLPERTRDEKDRLKGMKILAVDDHEDALELLSVILQMYGAYVVAASSAAAALAHLKSTRFDVMVSDLSMPEQDGFSLMNSIRQESIYPERALPAVALTAFADKGTRARAMSSGFNAFLGKPLQPETLAKTISEVFLNNQRPV